MNCEFGWFALYCIGSDRLWEYLHCFWELGIEVYMCLPGYRIYYDRDLLAYLRRGVLVLDTKGFFRFTNSRIMRLM